MYTRVFSVLVLFILAGCGHDAADSISESKSISDAISIVRRSDGKFDVLCRNGQREVRSESDVNSGTVCVPPLPPPPPPTPPADPFDPNYCTEPPMTEAQALSRVPMPSTTSASIKVENGDIRWRQRTCFTIGGCTAWGPGRTTNPEGMSGRGVDYAMFFRDGSTADVVTSLSSVFLSFDLVRNRMLVGLMGFPRPFQSNAISRYMDFSTGTSPSTFDDFKISKVQSPATYAWNDDDYYSPDFAGVMGQSCLKFTARNLIPVQIGASNTGMVEQEFVIFGRY